MKPLVMVVIAAISGAVGGSLISWNTVRAQPLKITTIRTGELVLVDENDKPAARLSTVGGETTFRLYMANSQPGIEIGVDRLRGVKYINLLNGRGRPAASLKSLPPNGESDLVLGDERWDGRITLGALRTDTDFGKSAIDDWGLEVRGPSSRTPLVSILVSSVGVRSRAGFNIARVDGTRWTAP